MKKIIFLTVVLLMQGALQGYCPTCPNEGREYRGPYYRGGRTVESTRGRRMEYPRGYRGAQTAEPQVPYETREEVSYVPEKTSSQTVDCATACRAGRSVSRDVCEQCNNCEGWGSDETIAECRDYPS